MPNTPNDTAAASCSSSTILNEKFEVPLTSYQENGRKITEVLVNLPSGKAYQSNPEKWLPQAPQKGNTCWYYALNRIRTRYGKNYRPNANRMVEQVISQYRRELSNCEIFTVISSTLQVDKLLNIDFSKLTMNELTGMFDSVDKGNLELLQLEEKWLNARLLAIQLITVILTRNEFNRELFNNYMTEGCGFTEEELAQITTAQDSKILSFSLQMKAYAALLADSDDSEKIKEIKTRFSLFLLALALHISSNKGMDSKKLTVIEVFDFLMQFKKIEAIKKLYKNLKLEPNVAFFERMLSEGVYNQAALILIKKEARKMSELLKKTVDNDEVFDLSSEGIAVMKGYFNLYQSYAFKRIIELYDLQPTAWQPKKGFDALIATIDKHGALVVFGKSIGLPANSAKPKSIDENGESLILGSRKILFWDNKINKQVNEEETNGHAIIIIGAQIIKHGDDTIKHVFYLDPNDASVPGEERRMYRVEYEKLEQRLFQKNGARLTSHEHAHDDSVYAIAGR